MLRRWLFIGGIVLATVAVAQMGTRSIDAQAEPLTPESLKLANCSVAPLGLAQDFSALVLDNISLNYTDFSGRVAVGGNAALRNSNVGTQLDESPERVDFDVRGNASFVGGAVPHGVFAVKGEFQEKDVMLAFPAQGESAFEFEKTVESAMATHARLKALNAHGQFNLHNPLGERYEVYIQARDTAMNVFVLDTNDLGNAHTLRIEGNESSTVVVVVKGDSVQMNAVASEYVGVRKENVLFFFPDARSLRVRSTRVQGSILAPLAKVEFANAVLEGQLVAKSLLGQGEVRKNPFEGCLPK